jgi:phosphoserine phosphatase
VLLLAGAIACARPAQPAPPASAWPLAVAMPEGNRRVGELDVSGNGRVDAADWDAFDRIASAAKARLEREGIDPSVTAGYYQGPAEGKPVLGLVVGADDVSAVPRERLRELFIEAHWLSVQARLAAAAEAPATQTVGGMLARAVPFRGKEAMAPGAVCQLAAGLKLDAYARAGLPATAIYDVDSTVWAGNGTDVFMAALVTLKLLHDEGNDALKAFLVTVPGVDRGAIERGDVHQNAELLYQLAADPGIPEEHRVSNKDSFYTLVGAMRGLTVEEAREAARVAVWQGAHGLPAWKTRILADHTGCTQMRVVKALLSSGVDVYFLSATPQVMVEAAGELFGLARGHSLGSILEIKDGRYTGLVADNSYSIKGAITRQWLPAPPILAAGDSPTSDFPMLLEATGAGFMINPRPAYFKRNATEAFGRLTALVFDGTEGELSALANP